MKLTVHPFSLPLRRPLETARGPIEARDGFLVELTDGEAVGLGEATPLPGWTESKSECAAALEYASQVVETTAAGDYPEVKAIDACETTPAARHAVSLAVFDLSATQAETPLSREFGAIDPPERIPVNATIGDGSLEETVSAATDAVAEGFRCLKLKVGSQTVEEDIERMDRVRDAVGPAVELRADANGAWNYSHAHEVLVAFGDLGVELVEQPLPATDLEGHAFLRRLGPDIALDEGLLEHSVDDILAFGAADTVILKPMALGGLDIACEIATWMDYEGLSSVVTTTIDAVVARTGAVHLAAALPRVNACGLATATLLAEDLGPDPAPVVDGEITVPEGIGLCLPAGVHP